MPNLETEIEQAPEFSYCDEERGTSLPRINVPSHIVRGLTLLGRLEMYLYERGLVYRRLDDTYYAKSGIRHDRHQIIVYRNGCPYENWFDVIFQHGSFGFEDGLLEIQGPYPFVKTDDSVEGSLTSDEIIKRIGEAING